MEDVKVITHSGFKRDEYPAAMEVEGTMVHIQHWAPMGREMDHEEGTVKEIFLVRTEDGRDFVLTHLLEEDKWKARELRS